MIVSRSYYLIIIRKLLLLWRQGGRVRPTNAHGHRSTTPTSCSQYNGQLRETLNLSFAFKIITQNYDLSTHWIMHKDKIDNTSCYVPYTELKRGNLDCLIVSLESPTPSHNPVPSQEYGQSSKLSQSCIINNYCLYTNCWGKNMNNNLPHPQPPLKEGHEVTQYNILFINYI